MPLIHSIFKRHLTDAEWDALTAKVDPTYLVMHAFEGNLNTVGVTQKITGLAKKHDLTGTVQKITDSIYPKMRFTDRPTLQLQEMIESPFLNALRGITARTMDEDVVQAYRKLAEQPQFKYLEEASYLNIAADRLMSKFVGKNTRVGRAMVRFANIQQRKHQARVTQTLAEHGEEFKTSVQNINPRAWTLMEEAYGTTDARVIADRFLAERMGIGTNENIDEAMRLIDEAAADDAVRAVQQTLDSMAEPRNFRGETVTAEGRRATIPDKDLLDAAPGGEGYVYHMTPTSNLDSIRSSGLTPGKVRNGARENSAMSTFARAIW